MNVREIDNLAGVSPLEKAKLKMDCERIRIERLKTFLTAASIIIPLLLGVLTFLYSMLLAQQRAKVDFEIKAVEIVLGAESPTVAVNKAIVLDELFHDSLPKNFKERMIRLYPTTP